MLALESDELSRSQTTSADLIILVRGAADPSSRNPIFPEQLHVPYNTRAREPSIYPLQDPIWWQDPGDMLYEEQNLVTPIHCLVGVLLVTLSTFRALKSDIFMVL